ncbi:MAG: MaoC family dehydratase N-terminal domain-containing protein [Pseudomonadota bacterium]|nr:MaoC family dehydratase N-terminal domain-containing protein [Pseudomonadota bacterium]
MVNIDDLKADFLNTEFDSRDFVLSRDNLVTAATSSGETRPEFTDPEHPDFQATPAFLCSLGSGRHLPIDFPALGGVPMDGGKAVEYFAPVRPDTPLTGRTHLHDIYDKKGRSGRMIFIVVRMEVYNDAGEHLATTDSRLVIREK